MTPSLQGKVCLVTGAARGIGRGIALQLGSAGATVYITGRTKNNLEETAQQIKDRGGKPVVVQMDHGIDTEVDKLFQKISDEQSGQLDLLVNNAYAGANTLHSTRGLKFWECPPTETWDCINGVGLRGHYHCTVLASKLMVERKQGLIVNISSMGGLSYFFNVAYGVGKAGCDRMAADCAKELKSRGVAMVSLWPGPVKTEFIKDKMLDSKAEQTAMSKIFAKGETVEFTGKAVASLAADKGIMTKTGRIFMTTDLAREYGFTEDDGSFPVDLRQVRTLQEFEGYATPSPFVPSFIRIPKWMLHFGSYKF